MEVDLFRDVLFRDRRVKRLPSAGLVWWERIYSAMFYEKIARKVAPTSGELVWWDRIYSAMLSVKIAA
ncbi:hypothetical protein EXT47_18470 [Pseudoalteromonas sp. CO342X]|uniref:hypothetical protein n=1 Tax=Pseudoalteromonas sp. CO342X TaxID=1777270 RepID=UPI0010236F9D|nr:hypothetical protein [Pseudoalteromonas sp. CO342X]RZG13008.1 hypothetical protein EXT47_18470 [Pseudoalteromonas sp. CO342X]